MKLGSAFYLLRVFRGSTSYSVTVRAERQPASSSSDTKVTMGRVTRTHAARFELTASSNQTIMCFSPELMYFHPLAAHRHASFLHSSLTSSKFQAGAGQASANTSHQPARRPADEGRHRRVEHPLLVGERRRKVLLG